MRQESQPFPRCQSRWRAVECTWRPWVRGSQDCSSSAPKTHESGSPDCTHGARVRRSRRRALPRPCCPSWGRCGGAGSGFVGPTALWGGRSRTRDPTHFNLLLIRKWLRLLLIRYDHYRGLALLLLLGVVVKCSQIFGNTC